MQSLSHNQAADQDSETQLARIRAVAAETLAVWPEARAAVLFGSRARGDHRPDSDWDVAFVTTGDADRISPVPGHLPVSGLRPDVQCLAVPECLLARKCTAIGQVVRGVVRDGYLLAGIWDRPETEGLVSTMQPDEYARMVNGAITAMRTASTHAALLGSTGEWTRDLSECQGFTEESVATAEYIGKAMLGRRGVDYRKVHDLNQLGKDAERAGFPDLAATLRSLNGKAAAHHLAQYEGIDIEGCQHAVERFLAASQLLAEELRTAAASPGFPGLARRLTRPAAFTAQESAAVLRRALLRASVPYPEAYPEGEVAPSDKDLAVVRVLMDARPDLAEAFETLASSLRDEGDEPPPPPSSPEESKDDDGGPGF